MYTKLSCPIKLKLTNSTPSKRPRDSLDDDGDVQFSPAKIHKDEGSRRKPDVNDDGNQLGSSAAAPLSPPGHVLQEDNTSVVRRIQGEGREQ